MSRASFGQQTAVQRLGAATDAEGYQLVLTEDGGKLVRLAVRMPARKARTPFERGPEVCGSPITNGDVDLAAVACLGLLKARQ